MWIWQTLMPKGSSAQSPWMGQGQQEVSSVVEFESCLHTSASIPSLCTTWGRKIRGGRGKVGLGTRAAGQCFNIAFFFSLVEFVGSDNKLNYFSPNQVCSAHDGNWQMNLPQYISNHEPFQFILSPVLLMKDDGAAGWVSKINPSQSHPVLQSEALCNSTKETVLYEPLFSS